MVTNLEENDGKNLKVYIEFNGIFVILPS